MAGAVDNPGSRVRRRCESCGYTRALPEFGRGPGHHDPSSLSMVGDLYGIVRQAMPEIFVIDDLLMLEVKAAA
jgi:hypothetical protein